MINNIRKLTIHIHITEVITGCDRMACYERPREARYDCFFSSAFSTALTWSGLNLTIADRTCNHEM